MTDSGFRRYIYDSIDLGKFECKYIQERADIHLDSMECMDIMERRLIERVTSMEFFCVGEKKLVNYRTTNHQQKEAFLDRWYNGDFDIYRCIK